MATDAFKARQQVDHEHQKALAEKVITGWIAEDSDPLGVTLDELRRAKAEYHWALDRKKEAVELRGRMAIEWRGQRDYDNMVAGLDEKVAASIKEIDLARERYVELRERYVAGASLALASATATLAKKQEEAATKAGKFNWIVGAFVIVSAVGTVVQAVAAGVQTWGAHPPQPIQVHCEGGK